MFLTFYLVFLAVSYRSIFQVIYYIVLLGYKSVKHVERFLNGMVRAKFLCLILPV